MSMLKMSFYDGTLNKQALKAFVAETKKPICYTYGFEFRNPTTRRVPTSKEEAIHIIDTASLLDATEEKNCLHLNAYSANDMW